MPDEVVSWINDFKQTLLTGSVADIAHGLCMLGVGPTDPAEYVLPTLRWLSANQDVYNKAVFSLIPAALKPYIRAYIKRDKVCRHFEKGWQVWMLEHF